MHLKELANNSVLSARGQRSFGSHMPSSSLHRSRREVSFIYFLPLPLLPVVLSPLVTGACLFPFVWGFMAGLPCCASHEGVFQSKGCYQKWKSLYTPGTHLRLAM